MATTSQTTTVRSNGDSRDPNPPASTARKGKNKKEKPSADENAKLIAARVSQLEQEKAGEKDQQEEIDREVKKSIRDLNQLFNNIESPLGRLEVVQKKYEELLAEMKKLEQAHARSKKRADQLQKEQDKSKSEHNKTATMKDKLEKLCRELTKENKKVKDENRRLEETEKTARATLNERLDQMLFDVQDVINAKTTSQAENLHLELDELFRTRCKVLADQADLREMHFRSILRHKDAEIAHLAAKHEAERKRADAEAARCRTLTNQVSTFSHTEAELRSQLNIYVEKFKQVEDTLNNSNELFLTFRKEMEEMSKKTKRLEKENLTLTRKHDQTNRNILEMAEERTRDKEELEKLHKKESHMRNIIKTMQEQGRGKPGMGNIPALPPEDDHYHGEDGRTESEYDEGEYEDEEDLDEYDDGEYEDELHAGEGKGEDVIAASLRAAATIVERRAVFGPPPPPDMRVGANGTTKAQVNGIKH